MRLKNIHMMVTLFKVPCIEPKPLFKNFARRSQIFTTKFGLNQISRSFLPSTTVRGLTQWGGESCTWISCFSNNSRIADWINCRFLTAEQLFDRTQRGGNSGNGREYPCLMTINTWLNQRNSNPLGWKSDKISKLHQCLNRIQDRDPKLVTLDAR